MDDLSYEVDARSVALVVDETVYPLDAIYGAAYLFIDRCYVHLSRPADRQVTVRLKAKNETSEQELEALAGEFGNELLNQTLRSKIGESTSAIRDYYLSRAFFSSPATASIDALLAELDAEELDDGLEVKLPWQEA